MRGPTAKCAWCGKRAYLKQDGNIGSHPVHEYNSGGHVIYRADDGELYGAPIEHHPRHICIGTGWPPASHQASPERRPI